jgi:putative membrane protein
VLLVLFAIIRGLLAITPRYRREWLIENLLVFIAPPVLILTYRPRFSNGAYTALFVFLVLGAIGAHYTYAKVPYDEWWASLTGSTLSEQLGFERNHYDRLVHFMFGALVTPLAVEVIAAQSPLRGAWRYVLPVCVLCAASMVFELLERFAVELWARAWPTSASRATSGTRTRTWRWRLSARS